MSNIFTTFAASLRAGTPAYAAFIGFSEALVTENLMRDGFDTAVIDMQHGLHTTQSAILAIGAAAAAGKPVFVRPPVGAFPEASRMLDAGAIGIVAPMINTIEDARQLAAYCKYPPLGERSWGPYRATGLVGLEGQAYLEAANDLTLAIAMVETRAALDILDEILAVPGIDGVFVGPSDLSIALSNGGHVDQFHADVDKALTHVANRCKAHGKIASCFAMTGTRAAEMIERGFHMSSIATDQVLLRNAAKAELAAAKGGLKHAAAKTY
ncbi:MAG: HpcH/HpaI aldolase family protein [Bosea sp. (in: a-proteobacteria)]